ncbi:YggS family pyridoxal phosphate-dependent enzyme [Sphingomonas sp. Marseille-Q8236]|jgi:hypothetical protein
MTDDSVSRLSTVSDQLRRAAKLGDHAMPILIAVSKTHDAETIRPLLDAGHRVFGENRVQEAAAKWPALCEGYAGVELHLIGQLQSNKAADAVALFDVIHTVDRPSLIAALAEAMDKSGRRPDCFLQVNIGEEEQKGGCAIAEAPAMLEQARAAGLRVIGLMAIPPHGVDAAPYFALLAKMAREMGLEKLSMGMSEDYEVAAMLGASHVRVGSALFGARQ